jgi:photosystem II stability/assembly factor-like uncharacterized protein
METDRKMLRRRALMSSMLGLGAGAALGLPALADPPPFQELVNPAIPVKNPTGVYLIAGASAGKRLFAGGEHGVIIYSDDQGQSWHQAAVPVSATITDIAFATDKVGWATGGFGVILNSQDGGQSWVKQLDGLAEIALMNQTTQAFIATQPPDSDVVAHLTRRASILTQEGPDKPFLSLLPISATEVFAFGTYRSAEYSTDGGKTWADWSLKIGDPAGVSKNIYGAAALYGAYYLVSETGLIYRSTDAGQTFPELAQPGEATFYGICDAGKGNILAFGVAGQMYLSTDNGKTWNAPNFTGSANVNAGTLLANGYVVVGDAGGGIWLSKDNGQNFTMVTRNPLGSVNALVPISGLRFLTMSGAGVTPLDLSEVQG